MIRSVTLDKKEVKGFPFKMSIGKSGVTSVNKDRPSFDSLCINYLYRWSLNIELAGSYLLLVNSLQHLSPPPDGWFGE